MPFNLTFRHKISDEAVSAIKYIHYRTKDTGRENQFNLCKHNPEDEELHPEKVCEGTVCSVKLSTCENYYGGSVHTHPLDKANPSAGDMFAMYWDAMKETKNEIKTQKMTVSNILQRKPNDIVECRTGKREMQCEYFSYLPATNNEMLKLYLENQKIYKIYLLPLYEEWEKTGSYPYHHPLARTACAYDKIIADKLRQLTNTNLFTLEQIEDYLKSKKK